MNRLIESAVGLSRNLTFADRQQADGLRPEGIFSGVIAKENYIERERIRKRHRVTDSDAIRSSRVLILNEISRI